jgi:hypothetical protein
MSSHEFDQLMREIAGIRKRQNAMLFFGCVLVLWVASIAWGNDAREAIADRHQFPESEWPHLYYFTVSAADPTQREILGKVLAFTVASLNRQTIIEQQLPVRVGDKLYRIHTGNLGWDKTFPSLVGKDYPYSTHLGTAPLVIRADWFVQWSLDQEISGDAYLQLLFGKKIEKLDDFLKEFGVDVANDLTFAHIETNSGVAINRTRIVASYPTDARTDCWITYDYTELNQATDPLENLTRGIKDGKHDQDASEIIVGLPKAMAATGQTGVLQAYLLADGNGNVQTKAPTNIVVDSTGVRGVEIRNPVSCVVCHVEGLRPTKTNGLRSYLLSGAAAFAKYEAQQEIERYHLTSVDKFIERNNEDYTAAIQAVNGLKPDENALAVKTVIQAYDKPVTLETAARELYTTPEVIKNALGWWSSLGKPLSARTAAMAHGQAMARTSWERTEYLRTRKIVHTYAAEFRRRRGEK